ncbi:MAG: glycoside hydrolase family 5 protein [Lachnospiraceae bacterium]|nr:glycoside hydrolase family 5 protein [Lachnospiraceae bacterium]
MKLNRGINLGGYLSQCCHEEAHYDSFIVKSDIEQIAGWGFDHVRIPVDYEVLETVEGAVIERGYERIAEVLDWCKEYGIDAILDLHKAYGYDFNDAGDAEKNNLFSSEALQTRFVDLWVRIIKRFSSYEHVAFELLNEVVEKENADAWNKLIKRTVGEIRKYAPTAPIIYGGIQWNSVKTLKLLDIPQDENIIFTFHFYEPLLFTHQKAYWVPTMDSNRTTYYPESMEYYNEGSKSLGYQGEVVTNASSKLMGEEFITEMIEEAIDAAKKAGVGLYCGEFGVINQAPVEDTLRWFTDVDKVFRKYNIGCAVWTYKEMDFGLTEDHYASIKDDLLTLWCK